MLTNLTKPTANMEAGMKKLGISITDTEGQIKPLSAVLDNIRDSFKGLTEAEKAKYAAMIFGKEAMAGMLAIINATDKSYQDLTESIAGSQGKAQEMAEIMNNTLHGRWTLFKSQVEELGISFGEVLEPKVTKFLGTASKLVDGFTGMSNWSKNLLIDITGLGLGLGVLLKIIGVTTKAIGLFKKGLVAENLAQAGGGIASLSYMFKGLAGTIGISVGALSAWTLGIGAVVVALGVAVSWIATSDERLAKFNSNIIDSVNGSQEKVKESQEKVKTAKEALAEIQRLEDELSLTTGTEERTAKEQELLDKKKELLNLFPELKDGFGSEAEAIDNVVGSTETLIKKQEELIALEKRKQANLAREYFSKDENKDVDGLVKGVDKSKQDIADLEGQLKELEKYSDKDKITITTKNPDGSTVDTIISVAEAREGIHNQIIDSNKELDKSNASLREQKSMYEAMIANGEILTDGEKERYKLINEQLEKTDEYVAKNDYASRFGKDAKISIGADPKVVAELSEKTKALLSDIESVDEVTKNSLSNMMSRLEQGFITTTQFETALASYMNASSFNFGALEGNVSLAMDNLLEKVSIGTLGFEDFNSAMEAMAMYSEESMGKLSDTAQQNMEIMLSSLNSGQIKAGDFQGAVSAYLSYAENGFIGLNEQSQTAMNDIVQQFANGEISAEQYQLAMGMMSAYVNSNFQNLDAEVQTTLGNLKTEFLNGGMDAGKFAQEIGKAVGLSEGELASLSGASAKDIGKLVGDLLNGRLKADELANALRNIPKKVESNVVTKFSTVGEPYKYNSGKTIVALPMSLPIPSEPPTEQPAPQPLVAETSDIATMSSPIAEVPSNPVITPYHSFSDAGHDKTEGMTDEQKKAYDERIQMERDANSAIEKMRDKLYKALKEKITQQKQAELDLHDSKIKAIQKEMEMLDKSLQDDPAEKLKEEQEELSKQQGILEKLNAEKEKWANNDSAYGKQKVAELEQKIAEQQKSIKEQEKAVKAQEVAIKKEELQSQIDNIEEEKEKTNAKYEEMLSDKNLYAEANKLITDKNMKEIQDLIENYAPDWSDIGLLFGQSLADGIKEGVQQGMDGYDYLKGQGGGGNGGGGGSAPTPEPSKSKGKVTAKSGLNVRTGAGTNNKIMEALYYGDEVEIVEEKNGWFKVDYYSRSNKGRKQGWVSGNYIKRFNTGGVVGDWFGNDGRIAVVDKKERVLTAQQTQAFDKLVYSWIPRFESITRSIGGGDSNSTINFNNTYNVDATDDFKARNFQDDITKQVMRNMARSGYKPKPI